MRCKLAVRVSHGIIYNAAILNDKLSHAIPIHNRVSIMHIAAIDTAKCIDYLLINKCTVASVSRQYWTDFNALKLA